MKTGDSMKRIIAIILTTGLALAAVSCKEKTVSRDHYPHIKAQVFVLQEAVLERNRAAIDSVLSVRILDNDQNSDSLLAFVYGPHGDYPFRAFADARIVYTDDKARVDCAITDTAGVSDRSITFTYELQDDTLWLLKRFEPTPDDYTRRDSTPNDSL